VDYEAEFRKNRKACGEPFPEFTAFSRSWTGKPTSVLDLGCGQGRDTLMIARLGHRVLAVDVSCTGVSQMLDLAKEEELSVRGVVADIRSFKSPATHDVVVLDRVLHMLPTKHARSAALGRAARSVRETRRTPPE